MQTKPTTDPTDSPTPASTVDENTIRALVTRLSRPHPSGGQVIERAAIMAEGADSSAVLAWITDHDGQPEHRAPATSRGGLHSARFHDAEAAATRAPLRYVLPPGTLG
jgi:hypothetical protein